MSWASRRAEANCASAARCAGEPAILPERQAQAAAPATSQRGWANCIGVWLEVLGGGSRQAAEAGLFQAEGEAEQAQRGQHGEGEQLDDASNFLSWCVVFSIRSISP